MTNYFEYNKWRVRKNGQKGEMMRRPNPTSILQALNTYYRNLELRTKDIASLFGCSQRKARQLKEVAKEHQKRMGVISYHSERVNTKTAYEAWGMDINDLENDYYKLKKLEMY